MKQSKLVSKFGLKFAIRTCFLFISVSSDDLLAPPIHLMTGREISAELHRRPRGCSPLTIFKNFLVIGVWCAMVANLGRELIRYPFKRHSHLFLRMNTKKTSHLFLISNHYKKKKKKEESYHVRPSSFKSNSTVSFLFRVQYKPRNVNHIRTTEY